VIEPRDGTEPFGDWSHNLNEDDRRSIEKLSIEYAWLIDHGRADEATHLFTDDAVVQVHGATLTGTAQIHAALQQRKAQRHVQSRHVVSNIRLQVESADRVSGTVALTVYQSVDAPAEPTPVMVGDLDDVYARGLDMRWRVASRRLVPVFIRSDHRQDASPPVESDYTEMQARLSDDPLSPTVDGANGTNGR